MKVLMFFAGTDSLSKSFMKGFVENNIEVRCFNFEKFNSNYKNKLYERSILFPKKMRMIVEKDYSEKIQKEYLKIFKEERPELVFIYNDQMVTESTLKEIKKTAKIAVFLADNPLYLERREHFIPMLFQVDFILAPDTYWVEQMKLLGLKNVKFFLGAYNMENPKSINISEKERNDYKSDLFYIGSTYRNSWGYKRALFLSKFIKTDIKIYGPNSWSYWFRYFPDLKSKMILGERLDFVKLQKIMNCCKLYPIDTNPGLVNGVHVRVYDSIASGLLPIVEYKADLKLAFPNIEIPTIKNYNNIPEIISECLKDDSKRIKLVSELQDYLFDNYNPKKTVNKLFDVLEIG